MSQVAANADDYAATRTGIFFPANNQTPEDGNLTGQCVTLVKWFMAEMADVPNPFAARGDARYVGQNLVAQGLADEVPYSQRKRGDIICLEYGTYGHIYVQLSDNRVFEENANIGGVARKVLSDGTVVYASRVGSDGDAFRINGNPHAYRLKSYKEKGGTIPMTDENFVTAFFIDLFGTAPTKEQLKTYVGRPFNEVYNELRNAPPHTEYTTYVRNVIKDNNDRTEVIKGLTNERDTFCYPAIDAIRANLGIEDVSADSIKNAVDKLKKTGVAATPLKDGIYKVGN
jgi:hypothetical protein